MIRLLLGGIAIYTLHENRKSIKRLRDIAANHQVNHQVNHQANNQANHQENHQENHQVIRPPCKIRINPSSEVPNFQTIMYKDNEWNLAKQSDLYIGREVIFTKRPPFSQRCVYISFGKYIGIIKKVNKKTIHVNSVEIIEPPYGPESQRAVIPSHDDLFIVKIPCLYVCYDDDEFDDDEYNVCKGEIN